MAESLFRRNPVKPFKSIVIERSQLLNDIQTIRGKSIQDRNPVWVSITGECMACNASGKLTVPIDKPDWDATYKNTLLPPVVLERVSISYGGDFGFAQKLTANISCFDINSFKIIRKHFLLPGNRITVRFGYATDKRWSSDAGAFHEIRGFKVATFSFSAGEDGRWNATFSAVAPSEALKSIDCAQSFESNGLKYSVGGKISPEDIADSTSIPEVIISDAQRNGTRSLSIIGSNNSGYLIGSFAGYTPTDESVMVARMAIYSQDHLRRYGIISDVAAWGTQAIRRVFGTWDESRHGLHEIYVTLGYVVDRLFNKLILKTVSDVSSGDKDIETFKKLRITFHPKWSKSKLPKYIESGNPLSVLILGGDKAVFKSDDGVMDFNKFKGFENATPSDVYAWDGTFVRLDKILLHRDVIINALNVASNSTMNEFENVDPKNKSDNVVNVVDFFESLFHTIAESTGGALKLRLVPDPNDDNKETIYVVDQNFGGYGNIDCFVFNPIDKLYAGRNDKFNEALKRLKQLKTKPGLLHKNAFNSVDISAMIGVMISLYKYASKSDNQFENINWPGIDLDLTINGAYGILPGCAVSTTQIPDDWMRKKIYFMVREVTHEFSESDWTNYIKL